MSLYTPPNFPTSFTEEFVREARKEVERANKIKSDAEAKIVYFGMYDS